MEYSLRVVTYRRECCIGVYELIVCKSEIFHWKSILYNSFSIFTLMTVQLTVAPNGAKANFTNLKHWRPKGIPIIVQHSNTPLSKEDNAKGIPLKIIQNILATIDTGLPPYLISFPNGKNARAANLKHWRPIGIPIIVILHNIPATLQKNPCHKPQHKNHIMFPKQLIPFPFL